MPGVNFVPLTSAPTHLGAFRNTVRGEVAAPGVTFPTTKLDVRVELQLGPFGLWTDISRYVKYTNKIRIMRGRRNEQGKAPASTCALTLLNQTRAFSPRNTTGQWYGQFNRNTKLRVRVNPGSGMSLRFTGEIPDWTPRFASPNDRELRIVATGQTRRFGQGNPPVNSPIYNAYLPVSDVVEYWPMEEGTDAITFGPGLPGGKPLVTRGTVGYASSTTLLGSKPLPVLTDTSAMIVNIDHTFNAHWQVEWVGNIPAAPAADTTIMRVYTFGAINRWEVAVGPTYYAIRGISPAGAVLVDSGALGLNFFFLNQWARLGIMAKDDGGGVLRWLFVIFPVEGAGWAVTGTIATAFGDVDGVHVFGQPGMAGIAMGHWVIRDAYNDGTITTAVMSGYRGETPATRFTRLCTAAGIDYTVSELMPDGVTMGPQTIGPPWPLIVECEEANEGLLDEAFTGALRLGSRSMRWNQVPALTADYTHITYGNQVLAITPTDDDFALRNDWTIGRPNGGVPARITLDNGTKLSISPPPVGVGRYSDSRIVNLATDVQTGQHAGHRVGKGTIDELRYPSIKFALHRNPELIPGWLACDVNSRIQVLNPPTDIGTDTIDQIIEGYAEDITQVTWDVEINGSPAAASTVGIYDSTSTRYDCAGSSLTSAQDAVNTGLDVKITDTCVWAHDNGDYVITIGGEDMLVTGVGVPTGSFPSRIQTLIVQRSYNGAVLTHLFGEKVHLKRPTRYALR